MVLIISFFLTGVFAHAEDTVTPSPVIRSISIFKNEIQLDVEKNNQIKSGTKILAKTAVNHKCLLVVKKVIKDLAYADATQCPGYATLKKGQTVTVTPDNEINEEIKSAPVVPVDNQKG